MTADMTPTNTPAPSLLPCPFCGNTGDIEQGPASQASGSHCSFRGWCDYCCFGLEWTTDQAEAIAAWNRRTPAPFNPMCASDGCDLPASVYFEKGGVGSHYCSGCGMRIQSLVERSRHPAPSETITQPSVEPVALMYTNWRGDTALRTVLPQRIWYGATEWHPDPQWLLTAVDVDKGVERDFALTGFASPSTEVERLTNALIDAESDRDRFIEGKVLAEKQRDVAEATNRSLEERLAEERAETVKVLEPFAEAAEETDANDDYSAAPIWEHPVSMNITIGHLRAARRRRAFLTKLKEGQ